MKLICKICSFHSDKRSGLLKHYRLRHGNTVRSQSVACLYQDCPCSFKTFNALKIHLSRCHVEKVVQSGPPSFTCLRCRSGFYDSEKSYFEHIGSHLISYIVCQTSVNMENICFSVEIF